MKQRRFRGQGVIYEHPASRFLWMRFSIGGKEYRESTGVTTLKAATDRLEARKAEIRAQARESLRSSDVTVSVLLDDLIARGERDGLRSVDKLRSHLAPVRKYFGATLASALATDDVEAYTDERKAAGRAPATIRRELEALRRAFRLAHKHTPPKVAHVPEIPLPTVQNARQGFVAQREFGAILANLEDSDVRDFVEFFGWTGMRPNEIRSLTWSMLNRESWTLRLDPKAAKIGEGRVIALEGPTLAIIHRRMAARRLDCPLIFHRVSKGLPGQPVKDIRLAWAAACAKAGLRAGRKVDGGLTPYDLRRFAVRTLIRANVHETVAMRISGHKTRSTFDRYNIADEEDVREAMRKTAAFVSANRTETAQAPEEGPLFLGVVAEAGGNRTHRCRCQPTAGRL